MSVKHQPVPSWADTIPGRQQTLIRDYSLLDFHIKHLVSSWRSVQHKSVLRRCRQTLVLFCLQLGIDPQEGGPGFQSHYRPWKSTTPARRLLHLMESVLREDKCVACFLLNSSLHLQGYGCRCLLLLLFLSAFKVLLMFVSRGGRNVFFIFNVLVNLRNFKAARASPQRRGTTWQRSATLQSCRHPTFLTITGLWPGDSGHP